MRQVELIGVVQALCQTVERRTATVERCANALGYRRIRETNTHGVLVRQFIHNSLYDRVSIRPFLENVEKKWIAFQLLSAVRDCHSRGVFHGDIKSENVMVTSWGWVYLTDFASAFKPVYLPEDNPADFTFYYDTSSRRTCYLAPERFLAAGERPLEGSVVQWNMDIFSLGCVLAELFTETPTFTLSQLFKYRRGEYDPTLPLLNKVDDEHVRALISSMIRLDPGDRWLAQDYLDEYKGKAFPLYFYNHLHTLMQEITDPTSGRKLFNAAANNNGLSDDRINRLFDDFEMLSASLGYETAPTTESLGRSKHHYLGDLFPLQVDLPNNRHTAQAAPPVHGENGTFILLNVITASVRSSARATSKLRACELLLAFAERIPDEAKLDRVLPYIMYLLDDTNEMVLLAALRTMTQLLALVTVVSPVNSSLFTQYIFPRLQSFVKSKGFTRNPLVRATYATCLASLAESASRFLDMTQVLKTDGSPHAVSKTHTNDTESFPISQDSYDATRLELLEQFEGQTKVFLTDTDNAVRRAFLTSVSSLCVFFGETRASDVILSHLNTYLNDTDWLLKCAFFRTIVGVAVYIGGENLEEFILPLILQALTDPQEFVIEQALRTLASMAELGALQRAVTWELIDTVGCFQIHPNLWIKEAASHFISAATIYLSLADVRILVAPLINPYLKVPVSTLDESELLDALKKPIPRAVLDLTLQWASSLPNGVFWKPAKESQQLSYRTITRIVPKSSVVGLGTKSLSRVSKTTEDEQWIGRLRNAGMQAEDEMKILAFREFLWRAAQRARRDVGPDSDPKYDQIFSLTKLKITPQTVMFDNDIDAYGEHIKQDDRTIAEALQEASNPSKANASKQRQIHETGNGLNGDTVNGATSLKHESSKHPFTGLRTQTSESLSSSPSSGVGVAGNDTDRLFQHRSSATALLSGVELRNKSVAEVASDGATAAGRLQSNRRMSPAPKIAARARDADRNDSQRTMHNYVGNDPTVLKLLDAVYVDTFPVDAVEFGPLVQQKAGPIPISSGLPSTGLWRPQGQLVAVLCEHVGAITRIVVAPDHSFFLTASDDGSIKVWDSARLERNVTHRSRQTYHLASGVKVTSLCFVDSTYSFVCTGSDGSVHVVKVDVSESNNTLRYGKLRTIREWEIPTSSSTAEYAVWSEHFRGETASTLILATNLGRILAVDLRYMSMIFELHNPASHGIPSCFCLSRRHDWLLVGTSHGVLDLWDLRFHLRLRSWTFPAAAPITRLQLHPSRKSSRRNKVCISGGAARGEVTVWDLEKVICYEIYRPSHVNLKERLHLKNYELRNLEDDKAEGLLTRVAGFTAAQADRSEQEAGVSVSKMPCLFGVQSTNKDLEAQHSFALTGGPDGKVRFWDCDRLEGCRVVNGGGRDEKPTYTFSQLSLDTRVLTEKPPNDEQSMENVVESNKVAPSPSPKRGVGTGGNKSHLRYDTIRMSAQNLLDGHLDIIADVALLERPFGMVLSGDRSGQVFVYQ